MFRYNCSGVIIVYRWCFGLISLLAHVSFCRWGAPEKKNILERWLSSDMFITILFFFNIEHHKVSAHVSVST